MSSIISAKNISFQIPYGDEVLKNVNIDLKAGEFLGVLGVNGAGKTALINLLLGVMPATSGELSILGENPHSLVREHKNKICYISQNIELHNGLKVEEFLEMYGGMYPKHSNEIEVGMCEYFSIDRDKKIGGLSLGQQKMVQVIAALSVKPDLLIVDEITAVFDEKTRHKFYNVMKSYVEEFSMSIILATNIAKDLIENTGRIMLVKDGESQYFSNAEIEQIFDIAEVA